MHRKGRPASRAGSDGGTGGRRVAAPRLAISTDGAREMADACTWVNTESFIYPLNRSTCREDRVSFSAGEGERPSNTHRRKRCQILEEAVDADKEFRRGFIFVRDALRLASRENGADRFGSLLAEITRYRARRAETEFSWHEPDDRFRIFGFFFSSLSSALFFLFTRSR